MNERWENAAHDVPCGKCVACLKKRRLQWSFRLQEEIKNSHSADFITLTYADAPVNEQGQKTLIKKDVQNWLKRLRKKNFKKIKYYAVGEYGTETQRPHYHAIMYNLNRDSTHELIHSTWGHGHISISPVNIKRIHYVTGYVMKNQHQDESLVDLTTGEIHEDTRIKQFALMSKGLGTSYLTPQMVKYHKNTKTAIVTQNGGKLLGLPRLFKEKIFTKTERQEIAQEQRIISELQIEKMFESAIHEIQYKKDQIRKHELSLTLEKQKL